MKTKIIYISGSEIFDVADIRAAFDEVRNALNLDKNTVLFGVPVDQDDAGLVTNDSKPVETTVQIPEIQDIDVSEKIVEIPQKPEETPKIDEIIPETTEDIQPVVAEIEETKPVKRARKRKREVEAETPEETKQDETVESDIEPEKIVPILSVLSVNEEETDIEPSQQMESSANIEIQSETLEPEEIEQMSESGEVVEPEDTEPDLEKLLSEMQPLAEDVLDDFQTEAKEEVVQETNDEENIDATLEQLATEFVQNQDKISAETKSSSRSKIGKLRNILPFKPSKHKDQGLGDLFGWAGLAANDEDFSVPGFFTNASSKR